MIAENAVRGSIIMLVGALAAVGTWFLYPWLGLPSAWVAWAVVVLVGSTLFIGAAVALHRRPDQ